MLNAPFVSIIDYGIGNLHSVLMACEAVGMNAKITSNKKEIETSDAIILPGVGAYGNAMYNLKKLDLVEPIKFAADTKPILCICLGMQLLMTESEEFGSNKGLGIIEGTCKKFLNGKVPQIMWNNVYSNVNVNKSPILDGINDGEYMYFVHSYYVDNYNSNDALLTSEYCNFKYTSAIQKNNIYAFQFHPEKSGDKGLRIYKNFSKIINSQKQTN